MLAWLRRQLDPPTILICIAVASIGLTWMLLNLGASNDTLIAVFIIGSILPAVAALLTIDLTPRREPQDPRPEPVKALTIHRHTHRIIATHNAD